MSRCVETDTYSPIAIESAPALSAAAPAIARAPKVGVAAATPTTMPATDTMPSFAPSTPARRRLRFADDAARSWVSSEEVSEAVLELLIALTLRR